MPVSRNKTSKLRRKEIQLVKNKLTGNVIKTIKHIKTKWA